MYDINIYKYTTFLYTLGRHYRGTQATSPPSFKKILTNEERRPQDFLTAL